MSDDKSDLSTDELDRMFADFADNERTIERLSVELAAKHGAWVMAVTKLAQAKAELAAAREDQARWQHIRDELARAHSPHMDGTYFFSLSRPHGRHASFTEAVDAARAKEKADG